MGIIKEIPFLDNTSFQDIAIVLDMWFILAIFIIVNCKSSKESVAKCFIFFLISQPLIYLTEVLIEVFINNKNLKDTFILYFKNYYLGAGWLFRTILTIPGAFIAYQIKRNNVLSSLILSVATFYLAFMGSKGLLQTINYNFPYHLLNSIICISMAYILIFTILEHKKERIISLIITSIGIIIGLVNFYQDKNIPININTIVDFEENITIIELIVEDENIAKAFLNEDGKSMDVYSSTKVGNTKIIAKDNNGYEYIYNVISNSRTFDVELEK